MTRIDSRELARTFDVICAGEAAYDVAVEARARPQVRAGGGAVELALSLAAEGLRVGLATTVADDRFGRAFVARIAERGVDVAGVRLEPPRRGLLFLARIGGARQSATRMGEDRPVEVPPAWTSDVLAISGLSPVVSHAAAQCKAARAARRSGGLVVVDVAARRDHWEGRDPRAVSMVLREADVVRCRASDHAALGVDRAALRAAMRPTSVLVSSDPIAGARASGPFGELAVAPRGLSAQAALVVDDALTAAVCAEVARAGRLDREELWGRAIERGHDAARRQG